MKNLFITLCLVFCCAAFAADKPSKVTPDAISFDFDNINVARAVQLIYKEALKESYVIDPEVVTDPRTVSFRYDSSKGELRTFIAAFFDSLGLAIGRRGSIDFVAKKVAPPPALVMDDEVFVYRPKFRDGSYLVEMLGPLFKGSFTSKRSVHAAPGDTSSQPLAPAGSAAASIDRKVDTIVFSGSPAEVDRMRKLLPQVDVAVGDVMVRGVLYEVQTDSQDGSAFGLALNLLRNSVKLDLGALTSVPGSAALRFKNNSIDAVVSALATDSRFKAVSKPMLRVTSGRSGRFTVGQDVPVLGAVSYPGGGAAPVQSVAYQASGVIYDVSALVYESSIEVAVIQQISNFVSTSTGVSGSPTLIKRELKSDLTLMDGEIVVMGGLTDLKDTDSVEGPSFLPAFLRTTSRGKSKIEILLVLQVTKL